MKGFLKASLAAVAITAVAATPLAKPAQSIRHRHLDHHNHNHKRAVVVITKTQRIVEIEYVYSTVYVDPAAVAYKAPTPNVPSYVAPSSTRSSSSIAIPTTTSTPTSTSTSTSTTSTTISTPEYVAPPPPPSTSEYVAPPPPPSTTESSTSTAAPELPTQVIPVYVPPSSSSSPTPSPVSVYTPPPPPPPPSPSPVETYVTPEPATTSTKAASGGGGTSYAGEMFHGEGTYYDCGLGSCGYDNTNDDYVVALSKLRMAPLDGGNPNNNPLCGKKIIVYTDMSPEGVIFTVMDKCPGCPDENDLDICKGPFLKQLGTEAEGRIQLRWQWVN
ncbi:hypothetical protein DRE_03834 [Drechslerella stenobrocha 248]|uniref:RlpA-like protein double-psi beta-barrel domain-containing protein n=1 Tax=Drechslerella stenobrocha 248 TaxID=1043628 RepID=W7I357_9PEZI|nr:hypothetical protein DRE_03834 [Drechslerella stenobrocha 248]